jgi:hypothetical protein
MAWPPTPLSAPPEPVLTEGFDSDPQARVNSVAVVSAMMFVFMETFTS